jgi:uncharacterized protein YndB with AHSA1/START domain
VPDILHRVGIKSSSPCAVYEALTTIDGLAGWWTSTTQGDANSGGTIKFRFGDRGFFDMKVIDTDAEKRVAWEVSDGPGEWVGTKVSFDLRQEGAQTTVLFKHEGWKAPVEFMHHCSTKWATFLMSLKALIETGKGAPFPNDVHITHNAD